MKQQENIEGVFLLLFIHLREIIEEILSYNFNIFLPSIENLKCTIEIIRSWRPYHPQQAPITTNCENGH